MTAAVPVPAAAPAPLNPAASPAPGRAATTSAPATNAGTMPVPVAAGAAGWAIGATVVAGARAVPAAGVPAPSGR